MYIDKLKQYVTTISLYYQYIGISYWESAYNMFAEVIQEVRIK